MPRLQFSLAFKKARAERKQESRGKSVSRKLAPQLAPSWGAHFVRTLLTKQPRHNQKINRIGLLGLLAKLGFNCPYSWPYCKVQSVRFFFFGFFKINYFILIRTYEQSLDDSVYLTKS